MKVVFLIHLTGETSGAYPIRKEIDLPFAPWEGMKVFDSVLHPNKGEINYYIVKDVELILECGSDETCLLATLKDYPIPENSTCEEWKEVFKSHGWIVSE